MFGRVLAFCGCLLVLSGCVSEPMPEVTHDYSLNNSARKVVQPSVLLPTGTGSGIYENVPKAWWLFSGVENKWTAIVIHHSGTKNGNAAIFDKWHKEGNHWEGVGYDFVIGNGTDSGDGEVEVTFRWRKQITGAHCGTPGNWANKEAIGICLVGDFNKTAPTIRQRQSIVKLVRFLQKRYGISKSRIYGHNTTPGARVTDCPGKKFPMPKLKSMLDF